MAKNRMKKTELVTRYETDKGWCRLYHPTSTKEKEYKVLTSADEFWHKFPTRAEAMEYIREQLL